MAAAPAFAAEKLAGLWQMVYQQVGGAKTPPEPLAIRITQTNGAFRFDYLLNREMELTRTFTAKLDGSAATIRDSSGAVKGIARLTKVSDTEYTLIMQSPFKPQEPGKLILAEKGNLLRCESDAIMPNHALSHVVQVFARQTDTP